MEIKGVYFDFLNINIIIVTNNWEGPLRNKIMILTKVFRDIPDQNGGLPKFTICRTFPECHFEQGRRTQM